MLMIYNAYKTIYYYIQDNILDGETIYVFIIKKREIKNRECFK